jgi:hypothetical protein
MTEYVLNYILDYLGRVHRVEAFLLIRARRHLLQGTLKYQMKDDNLSPTSTQECKICDGCVDAFSTVFVL